MVAEAPSRGGRLFPEIRIRIGSSKISLPPALQIAAGSAMFVAAIALYYLAISRIAHERLLTEREAAVMRAEIANADLRDQVSGLQRKLAAALGERAQANTLRALLAAAEAKLRPLDEARRRAPDTAAASERLQPPNWRGGLRLAGWITTDIDPSEIDPLSPKVLISDAPPEAERESAGVAEIGRRAIGEMRRLLASTGLNIERLFPQFGPTRAEGGPFVVPPKDDRAAITPERLEAIRSLIKSLPLSTPLDRYQLESRFGPRHDPFNRRLSFHTGIDLSAPYMSPVHATAAGIVTFAGYRSDYGRVVEIDHGNGISTVYGHLHRYIVSVGQTVTEHAEIGFLGSTGRSSGPHVHYEVLVNGEWQDPEKFIGLARVIPAAER